VEDFVLYVNHALVVIKLSGLCTGQQMANVIDYYAKANSYVHLREQCSKLIHSEKANVRVKKSLCMRGGM
jgi:hypothetical protein